jgi:intracellular sulfur oxidation DsrE/DsrF family protein
MAGKILQIVENAYRATIEEQDDTVVWFTRAIRAAGAEVTVLLRANAVNYAVRGQDAAGLEFGGRKQTRPPDLAGDVAALVARGVDVHVVEEDVAARGLGREDLVPGLHLLPRAGIPALVQAHAAVWHW